MWVKGRAARYSIANSLLYIYIAARIALLCSVLKLRVKLRVNRITSYYTLYSQASWLRIISSNWNSKKGNICWCYYSSLVWNFKYLYIEERRSSVHIIISFDVTAYIIIIYLYLINSSIIHWNYYLLLRIPCLWKIHLGEVWGKQEVLSTHLGTFPGLRGRLIYHQHLLNAQCHLCRPLFPLLAKVK